MKAAMDKDVSIHIAWSKPDLCDDDYRRLKSCFDTNWISQGQQVRAFEERVAALAQRRHCVAVNSGSSALTAALLAVGVSPEREVVIPALSFIAVPHSIIMLGAIPVFADVDRRTGMMTPETMAACISDKTDAVVGIDYAGFTQDWRPVHKYCRELRKPLPLIVDAASSFLAAIPGFPAGKFGDMTTYSFHTAKTITTGEGGAIVTDNKELALKLRQIRNHGELLDCKYSYDRLGGNFRMTDIAACLGLSQLDRLNQIAERRRQVMDAYLRNDTIRARAYCLHKNENTISNGFTFTVMLPRGRDALQQALQEYDVETRIMWPLSVNQETAYGRYPVKMADNLENARLFSRSCLSLPVHCGLKKTDIRHVISAFEAYVTQE